MDGVQPMSNDRWPRVSVSLVNCQNTFSVSAGPTSNSQTSRWGQISRALWEVVTLLRAAMSNTTWQCSTKPSRNDWYVVLWHVDKDILFQDPTPTLHVYIMDLQCYQILILSSSWFWRYTRTASYCRTKTGRAIVLFSLCPLVTVELMK